MRFRGKLVDTAYMQHFSRIITTISKLAKVCVLRITREKLYFILSEKAVNGGVKIWCELSQGHFFEEFALDGLSPEHNEIYLELIVDNLVKALRTAHAARWIKIKLTKKHVPCLTLEIDLPTLGVHTRSVVHDIPVTVVPLRLWDEYEEPEVPNFDVSIGLPQLKLLRSVIDRMKNLSNYVMLSANQVGDMKLMVETDMVSVNTYFKDLPNPTWSLDKNADSSQSQSQRENRDPQDFAEARIDIRKFAQFLGSQQVNPTRLLCNIVHNRIVHFFLLHDEVSLQYFMPAVSS